MRFFLCVLLAGLILYAADAAFTSGKYAQSFAAIGRSMAHHFGVL